ncbi:hypothetical protein HMPREF0290_1121 [Corynebacterium efficiens YS-314]|nr:hypothetical protein HMPREF0290_1121 [Corynebacterium efficiens YS-314]
MIYVSYWWNFAICGQAFGGEGTDPGRLNRLS